ncbi:hypothetical protein F4825DRAFT_44481 [Nemania diffusa]|nr:hypothetical protein F4825DRAFT_44481 [Nemania diffusa]
MAYIVQSIFTLISARAGLTYSVPKLISDEADILKLKRTLAIPYKTELISNDLNPAPVHGLGTHEVPIHGSGAGRETVPAAWAQINFRYTIALCELDDYIHLHEMRN